MTSGAAAGYLLLNFCYIARRSIYSQTKKRMKKIYLYLAILFLSINSFAQVSVTATAGATGPVVYSTLKTAFDAVNAGTHQGIISILITGNSTETVSAVLNASGSGSATYTALSIKPGGGAARTISGTIDGPLLDLNGADNIVIDGLNSGGNALSITNSSLNAISSTIRFINDATTDSILNASIFGADTSITSGTIVFSTAPGAGNDNNVISNCNISDAGGLFPTNAIYSYNIVGQENSGIRIMNNNISNFFNPVASTAAILLSTGNTDWTITGNKFFQTAARTFTAGQPHRVIQVIAGNNYNISDNVIGSASAAGTGTYTLGGAVTTRFLAIDLAVGLGIASSVQNNTINNMSFQTSNTSSSNTGIWCAINIATGNVNVGTVSGNTIGSTEGTGNITINPTAAGTLSVGIVCSSVATVTIANNNIGSIDVIPSGVLSGNLLGINVLGLSGTITVTHNTIGNPTANNMRVGTLGTSTGNGIIRGVLNANSGTINITNNTIRNLTHYSANALALFRAIECQQGLATITGNTISDISANGLSATALTPEGAGILVSTAVPGLVIDQNTITNLNVINSTPATGPFVTGIYLSSAVTGVSVTKNKIYGFTNAGTSASATAPPGMIGIYCRDAGAASPNILLANNMISLGNSQTTNTCIIGIWNASASTNGLTMKIYYNSVNIEGTAASGAQPSFCYYRGDFSTAPATPVMDIRNNIFTNYRTGGTGKHYAIANGYPSGSSSSGGWGTNASNYNVLAATGATVGYWSGDQTFAGWQTAAASDANSTPAGVNYVNSASDLHLVPSANSPVNGKATPIAGQTIDIDNDTRDAVTPDPGADEFTPIIPVIFEYFKGKKQGNSNVLNWKAFCTSPSVRFDIEKRSGTTAFIKIGSITATQLRTLQAFDFTDNNVEPGTNYYRLKMTESDGAVSYSITIAILGKEKGFEVINLMPTLIDRGSAVLNVSAAQNGSISIVVSDVAGKRVLNQSFAVTQGSNSIPVKMEKLSAGIYQISVYNNNERAGTIRFVKQ